MKSLFRRLARDKLGAMMIETAFVVPILATMCLGGFEVSAMIARDTELQTALAEAAAIALTKPPEADPDLVALKAVVLRSTGLDEEEVTIGRRYRCNTGAMQTTQGSCDDEDLSSFIRIEVSDTYTPMWVGFGVGEPVEFYLDRTVQIS